MQYAVDEALLKDCRSATQPSNAGGNDQTPCQQPARSPLKHATDEPASSKTQAPPLYVRKGGQSHRRMAAAFGWKDHGAAARRAEEQEQEALMLMLPRRRGVPRIVFVFGVLSPVQKRHSSAPYREKHKRRLRRKTSLAGLTGAVSAVRQLVQLHCSRHGHAVRQPAEAHLEKIRNG